MARINRSDVIQKAVNDLAISTSQDKVPNETLDKVQLTYDLNRRFSSWAASNQGVTNTTVTVTLPTIDSRSDIYLTGISAGFIKDVTCDQATGNLSVKATTFEQGIAKDIIMFPVIALTAQSAQSDYIFSYPLKLKPNTNLTMTSSYTAGVMARTIACTGFVVSTN